MIYNKHRFEKYIIIFDHRCVISTDNRCWKAKRIMADITKINGQPVI
jgi:hypothetical protein